ncbi:MAG: ABC transporter substrate-binding protein [Spirochaetes bacterium]|nr:ABC transporter substrate-binding protein [Spirochaetota bacterium]
MMQRIVLVAVLILSAAFLFAAGQTEGNVPFEDRYQDMSWDEIVAEANGQDVYFYMWGGADHINNWVSGYFKDHLKNNFNINLEMVPIDGAPVYVNKVLGEKQAGKTTGGAVDVVWVNGENFKTMRQADLLFGPYADMLPNITNCSPDILGYDFGYPINGYETPYGAAQRVMEYDTAKVAAPPMNIGELFDWAKANPGKLTYPAPPDFTGSVFVRHVFYYVAGGYEKMMGSFDEAVYNEIAPKVWALLNEVEPYLWRQGTTYPESSTKTQELLGNGEIYFNINYGPDGAANNIDQGSYPETVMTYMFNTGMIGNINFVAISFNSDNKAASMVMANELLSAEVQYAASLPNPQGGMSWMTPLDLTRITPEYKEKFASLPIHPSRLPTSTINQYSVPEIQADWLLRIEEDWQANVLRK